MGTGRLLCGQDHPGPHLPRLSASHHLPNPASPGFNPPRRLHLGALSAPRKLSPTDCHPLPLGLPLASFHQHLWPTPVAGLSDILSPQSHRNAHPGFGGLRVAVEGMCECAVEMPSPPCKSATALRHFKWTQLLRKQMTVPATGLNPVFSSHAVCQDHDNMGTLPYCPGPETPSSPYVKKNALAKCP